MHGRLSLPACLIGVVLAFCATPAFGESAIGQLEDITGQRIERPSHGGGYQGGYQSNDEYREVDPVKQADAMLSIFLVPIPIADGMFRGCHWMCRELAGKRKPGQGFFRHYTEIVCQDMPGKEKGCSGGFWARAGGLPFMVLYPVAAGAKWTGGQVADGGSWVGAQFDSKYHEYRAISSTYESMRFERVERVWKIEGQIKKAEGRRTAFLDDYIHSHSELAQMAREKGLPAARERATKQLDIYAKSLAERQRLRATADESINEVKALRDKAFEAVHEHAKTYTLQDRGLEQAGDKLDALLKTDLAPEAAHRLLIEKKALDLIGKAKTAKTLYDDWKKIQTSWENAKESQIYSGQTTMQAMRQWLGNREVREDIWRTGLHALGDPGDIAEKTLDASYATAAMVYSGQLTRVQREMDRINQISSAHDAYATQWMRANTSVKSLQDQLRAETALRDKYDGLSKHYEQLAEGRK